MDVFARFVQESVLGRPQMLLIQGESGVGETRPLKEVRSLASYVNVEVCYCRYYEDSALAHPLFIEALLTSLLRIAEDGGAALEAEANILRQLLSLENNAAQAVHSAGARPDQERLALFFSITRVAVQIAQYCPLALAIDDLQWADQLSLDLLTHLVFAVADAARREPAPLCILGAYRPVEPRDRLARAIARFQPEDMCQTLKLVFRSGMVETPRLQAKRREYVSLCDVTR